MKNNLTPKSIDEMHFDRLTLVYGQYAGKAHVPVNSAAEIVACKGGPVEHPITSALVGAFKRLGLANKSTVEGEQTAAVASKDASVDESIADALQSTARCNLYGSLYDMEWAIAQIVDAPGFDDASRRAAIDAVIMKYGAQIAALVAVIYSEDATAVGEVATKSGARHSAADIEKIQAAHKQLGEIADAANKGREATTALLEAPAGSATPAGNADSDAAGTDGEKSAVVPAVESVAATAAVKADETPAADTTLMVGIDGAAVKAAIDEALANVNTIVADAVKAAVEPLQATTATLQADLAAQTARADVATAEAATATKAAKEAKKALDTAIDTARSRQAPAGHQDTTEAAAAQSDAVKSDAETAPAVAIKDMTIGQALRVLHAPTAK
jgi:hypothetical protein